MNVGELIAELSKYDATHEVIVEYSTSSGSCCHSYEEDVEKFVEYLFASHYNTTEKTVGPRGGKPAYRIVNKPSVVIRVGY